MTMLLERLQNYLGLVRFSHTIFALPFALMSALVAARGIPPGRVIGWILVCMVGARTAAMTFNRIVDRNIDALNPRTRNRHLPSGKVSLAEAIGLFTVSVVLFFWGAWELNDLAFQLSPLALFIICGYSFCKRFTSISHFVLGLSLGIAPVGAWIGVTEAWALPPFLLGLAVLFWVAGFDVIYALLDESFDRQSGMHSLVVALGPRGALKTALLIHLCSIMMIFIFGMVSRLNGFYWCGACIFTALILYEHYWVRPNDASRINLVFFNVNGIISIGLFCFTLLDVMVFPIAR